MKLQIELGWTHEECVTYGNEYVAVVGIDNLKPYELPYLPSLTS